MNFHALSLQAALLRLDLDIEEARMLELETRATEADARAEAAWDRLMGMASR